MEGGGALCEDTSVTHPVQSDDPDIKDRRDDPHTSDRGDADSAVCSEDSMPRGIDFSDTQPRKSDRDDDVDDFLVWRKYSMSRSIDLSDMHLRNSSYTDSAVWSLDSMPRGIDMHLRNLGSSGYADSAVWSLDSMPRGIDFSDTQPHKKSMERTAPDSHGESDKMSLCSEQSNLIGPSFSEDNYDESLIQVCHRCEGACGVCLGNVDHAVKHCKTCSVSYCEKHVADHYKSPAFSSHQLVDHKKTSRESPATEHSLQRSSSEPAELPELRVMMLGKTGAGKSASGNTILGREAFKSEASALPVTKSCDRQSGVVEGRNIIVIDTPAITRRKAAWLLEKVDPGPHVFLLVIPLGRFTEEDGKEVKWIQSNFGEEALKFTIVLFTREDQMDQIDTEQFLDESSGPRTLVSSTGGGYHIFDNKTPRGHGQVKGLLEKIELLLRKNIGYSYSHGLHAQVKTAVREEEERKRREEEGERKRFSQEQRQNMEKRIKQKIMEQMELKMISLIANATATLNELREVVKATTEQIGNCLHEQVKTAVREEEERMIREEEEKEEKWERLEMEG